MHYGIEPFQIWEGGTEIGKFKIWHFARTGIS